jgi:hypothetical protein
VKNLWVKLPLVSVTFRNFIFHSYLYLIFRNLF